MTDTNALWRRSRELTEEIAALEATGQPSAAVIHQNRVKERDVLISQLRRAYHVTPTIEELLA